jgi:hypothetical protein
MESPAMVGGAHRPASTPRRRKTGVVGHRHTARSRSRTRPRRREARTGKRPRLGGVGVVGRRHTARSRTRTRPQRWEAHADKHPTHVGRRHTAQSRSRTRLRRREARTGKHRRPNGGEVPVAATRHGAATGLAREVGGTRRHHQHAVTQDLVMADAITLPKQRSALPKFGREGPQQPESSTEGRAPRTRCPAAGKPTAKQREPCRCWTLHTKREETQARCPTAGTPAVKPRAPRRCRTTQIILEMSS